MATSHNFPPFNQGKESWDAFVACFECFLIANGYTNVSTECKRAYFLSFCGTEMFETAMTLMAPQSIHLGTWEDFMGKLKWYYVPAPSRIAQQQHFYHRDQAPGESINQYVAALRKAAWHCHFVNLDNYLLDHLVSGGRDQHLKQRLIAKQELTFQEALDEACAAELATLSIAELPRSWSMPKAVNEDSGTNEIQAEALSESEEEELGVCCVRETKQRAAGPKGMSGAPFKCFSCGGDHLWASCKFKEAICRRCGRQGHIAKVCQAAQPQSNQRSQAEASKQCRSGPPKEHAHDQRGFSAVNPVAPPRDTEGKKIMLTIQIEGRPCPMEVDTDSATSIVSWSTIKCLAPKLSKCNLDSCSILLKDYHTSRGYWDILS